MQLDPRIDAAGDVSGWVLVEARLGRGGRHFCSRLLVRRLETSGEPEEIILPILPSGRIHELVRLPDEFAALEWQLSGEEDFERPRLNVRRVGWIERIWRMANRVLRTYIRLSRARQSTAGLAPWHWVADLAAAYRVASEFRVRYSYGDWIKRFDTLREEDVRMIGTHLRRFPRRPHFHVVLRVGEDDTPESVQATLASLHAQLYGGCTHSVLDSRDLSDEAAMSRQLGEISSSLAAGDAWLMMLRAGDRLAAHALYWMACGILEHPDAVIIYADDDALDPEGQRCDPRFKPDWSLAHLRSTHFVGDAVVVRGSVVIAAGGVRDDCRRHGIYDLLLRVVDAAGGNVHHVPAVLLHERAPHPAGRAGSADERDTAEWQAKAVRAHLARNGIASTVEDTRPGCRRVRYSLPAEPPFVSIIVPTRDALPLLRRCVEGVLQRTVYPRLELLVIDNQSTEAGTLEFLKQAATHAAVRVLRYSHAFNFSAINNFAARAARGAVLCLLNNDTEVISDDWLAEMVGHLLQPCVGAVGAKLYYPDGRVQHAGDAVGPGGCANHFHSLIDRDDPGYCMRAAVAQELSAVTAACLVTWRNIYLELGGLDEKWLGVAFNDVDYCLRVRAAGYRVVWTPHAELYHHESVSRGANESWRRKFQARREVATMRRRWGHVMRRDPFYNPNLSYEQPDFSLSRAPRVSKPWRPE